MRYKAFLTDFDDTLYGRFETCNEAGIRALVHTAANSDYGEAIFGKIAPETIRAEYIAARDRVKDRMGKVPAARSRRLYIQNMMEKLVGKVKPDCVEMLHDDYWQAYCDNMLLIPGAKQSLELARDRGMHVGIITNMFVEIQNRKLMSLRLYDLVDSLTTSEEAGVEKPDPRIFELALAKAKCAPSEALYIGNEVKADIEPAEKLGMRTVLITGPDDYNRVIDILSGKD